MDITQATVEDLLQEIERRHNGKNDDVSFVAAFTHQGRLGQRTFTVLMPQEDVYTKRLVLMLGIAHGMDEDFLDDTINN